jgi:HAD superfamily hydrolase (TIGR01490 family)
MATISSEISGAATAGIAFFDLDRTLTKAVSGSALTWGAYKKGLLSWIDLGKALSLSLLYRLNLLDPLKIINKMVKWTKGIPEKTLNDLCSDIFHETIFPSVYREARDEIKYHKEHKFKVIILSSALAPICRAMAISLGFDDIICSDLETKNGYLTGNPVGKLCFGEEKRVRLTEYCRDNNSTLSDTWYYGDSISDLPALNITGTPVCVNPDKKLARVAHKRGWRILKWSL